MEPVRLTPQQEQMVEAGIALMRKRLAELAEAYHALVEKPLDTRPHETIKPQEWREKIARTWDIWRLLP